MKGGGGNVEGGEGIWGFLGVASAKLLSPSRTDLAGGHLAGVGALWRALPLDLGRMLFPLDSVARRTAVQFPPPPHITPTQHHLARSHPRSRVANARFLSERYSLALC